MTFAVSRIPDQVAAWGAVFAWVAAAAVAAAEPVPLFDGRTLEGWTTKDEGAWRVEGGAIAAGDGRTRIPRNSFLFTEGEFGNFELKLEFRLTGDPATGMINSGIQFRSEMLPDGNARGYQADIGDPEWWGCLYDEHRRNRIIAKSDMKTIEPILKRDGWNTYVIRCEGSRIRLYLNGVLTVDYVEKDVDIPGRGRIAVQVHGGGAAKVEFRKITLEELATPESPLTPAAQKATFIVPEGFEVELVASEETGLPKPITVAFDDAGRLWSITATEYPVDANDDPQAARALWERGGRDRVVVIDDPAGPGPHEPRTFADGLAMPMGVLPWGDGAIVGQGPEVLFLRDVDGDGRADVREVLLRGFGVQDSHLLPHQFTRGPGGWVYLGQGAFNRSEVVAGEREPVEFDYCKLGRFRPRGARFEVACWGPNNIWGLVLRREGEMFIQEANDLGHSVIPFQLYTTLPGIGNQKFRPYAPVQPSACPFRLGGTGLSGLAFSDDRSGSFPDPWHHVMFVANPITRTINAVRLARSADGWSIERIDDFLSSTDEWFRPIAMGFGPDGCLYIVDWYNKIISHNEVPRDHPDRDKTRGRVWRVRHATQEKGRPVPDLTALPAGELPGRLRADSTWEMRAAWHQLVDRGDRSVVPALVGLAGDASAPPDARIHALWSLEGLGAFDEPLIAGLLASADADLRREAARALREFGVPSAGRARMLAGTLDDPDFHVRTEAIRTLAGFEEEVAPDLASLALLIRFGRPELRGGGEVRRFNRAFERTLVRAALEAHPDALAAVLDSDAAGSLPEENRLFASLALPDAMALPRFVRAWEGIDRAPDDEELLLLVRGAGNAELRPIVREVFEKAGGRRAVVEACLRLRERIERSDALAVLLEDPCRALVDASDPLGVDAAGEFRLSGVEPALLALLEREGEAAALKVSALEALSRLPSLAEDRFRRLAADPNVDPVVRRRAVGALVATGRPAAAEAVARLWPVMPAGVRAGLVEDLSSSAAGARALLACVEAGALADGDLPAAALERMRTLLDDDADMTALWERVADRFERVLRLDGGNGDFAAAGIDLGGPFTVETWVRLDPPIHNDDGILGRPGGADFNFFQGTFRVYGGPGTGDLVVASRAVAPGSWTHVAVTRDAAGWVRLFLNGEEDARSAAPHPDLVFAGLDIGRSTPADSGTAGELTEFRVWDRARTPDEIRGAFDRALGPDERPDGLVRHFAGAGPWPDPQGTARTVPVADGPGLLDAEAAAVQAAKLERFRQLALREGDPESGKEVFNGLCLGCHTLGGQGANAAPALDGSGHRSPDGLLRAIITPNAAVEAGYRAYRVETVDGRLVEGFLVRADDKGTTLRFMGGADQRIPADAIARQGFTNRSFMLEGLVENLPEQQVADLFAYLRSLK